jgi:hypothetical protein
MYVAAVGCIGWERARWKHGPSRLSTHCSALFSLNSKFSGRFVQNTELSCTSVQQHQTSRNTQTAQHLGLNHQYSGKTPLYMRRAGQHGVRCSPVLALLPEVLGYVLSGHGLGDFENDRFKPASSSSCTFS